MTESDICTKFRSDQFFGKSSVSARDHCFSNVPTGTQYRQQYDVSDEQAQGDSCEGGEPFFTNSGEDDKKRCENRSENQTGCNHLYIAGDRCTVAVTVKHWSSVTPEPLHSVTVVGRKCFVRKCMRRFYFIAIWYIVKLYWYLSDAIGTFRRSVRVNINIIIINGAAH